MRVTPAECLGALWDLAQRELAGDAPGGRGAVVYHSGWGFESGWYDPAGGLPHIWLWRIGKVPDPPASPDLSTQPLEDACTLAHEYGHFLSDRAGNRTAAYVAALDAFHGAGRALSQQEQAEILAEEVRAWEYGREALAALGCTDWDGFEECRWRWLSSYSKRFDRPAPSQDPAH